MGWDIMYTQNTYMSSKCPLDQFDFLVEDILQFHEALISLERNMSMQWQTWYTPLLEVIQAIKAWSVLDTSRHCDLSTHRLYDNLYIASYPFVGPQSVAHSRMSHPPSLELWIQMSLGLQSFTCLWCKTKYFFVSNIEWSFWKRLWFIISTIWSIEQKNLNRQDFGVAIFESIIIWES